MRQPPTSTFWIALANLVVNTLRLIVSLVRAP